VFLPFSLATYFAAPARARNLVLLCISIAFYITGERRYFWLLALLIAVNYCAARALDALVDQRRRRAVVTAAIAVDLGALGWFKYAGFVGSTLSPVFHHAIWQGIILPLGISFYVFHNISYVVDVYRRIAPARRNPIDFGLYISFFPQVIAGPIIRYHDISAFIDHRRVRLSDFSSGLERFLGGLAKKTILANPFGAVADQAFVAHPATLTCGGAWLGIICYTLQIYFDFSGYSDMAIGLARMFGFEFLENFNYPYISRSMQEFWRRWHISLSNWFLEYLYVPLGGNRHGTARTAMNLVIVFLLCGFWHGAAWTFIVWGAMHGALLGAERVGLGKLLARLPGFVARAYTLLAIVLTWVVFRADTLHQAAGYYVALFHPFRTGAYQQVAASDVTRALMFVGIFGATGAFTWLARDWPARAAQVRGRLAAVSVAEGPVVIAARVSLLLGLTFLSFLQLAANGYNPFIYFRF
jgi:alginate O-acetyltransferase complex protein AlgI